VPFLEEPKTDSWPGPVGALTVIQAHNRPNQEIHAHHYSLRTERWRYIRYNSGVEELYDHENDPYEWTNVCSDPALAETKAELRTELFRINGRPASDLQPQTDQ
jgi:iduronate 2-sulfatase